MGLTHPVRSAMLWFAVPRRAVPALPRVPGPTGVSTGMRHRAGATRRRRGETYPRNLGEPMAHHARRRRTGRLLAAVLLVGAMTMVMSGTAIAVHDEEFQLDTGVNGANTVDDPGAAEDFDWESFFNATGPGGTIARSVTLPSAGFPGFTASGGTADFALPDATTYTTGSKDTLGIQGGWQCARSNNVGDKVDIVNAYALAYVRPSDNHLILYYGVEKSSPLGNSNIATWFLKDGTVDCTSPGGATNFSGAHQDGDILLVSAFTNGGATANVQAFRWNGNDTTGSLGATPIASGQLCGTGSDEACSTVNRVAISPPWAHPDKNGGALDAFEFFEGGVDVGSAGAATCFATAVMNTRSSASLTATLFDYARFTLPVCGDKSGVKFHDLNADGDQDASEPGLNGWPIKLYRDSDADKVLDAGEATPVATTTTSTIGGVAGSYLFSALAAGTYIVCEAAQPPADSGLPTSGWNESLPSAGQADAADCTSQSGDTTLAAVGRAFTLAGQNETGNDFGNFRNATKSGTKFEDLDADGVRDAGEPGLADVQIHLFGTDGAGSAVHQHATTDANGAYSFSVAPGSYTVCETVPDGFTQSFPTSGADCTGHDGAGGFGYAITLTSGEIDSGNDFGNFRNATVSGRKFKDANANGTSDAGEAGLSGWQIHLFGTDTRGNAVHEHTTTDALGTYGFSVAPGTYTVCETISDQPGWVQSFPTTGADCTGHTHDGITPAALGHSVTVTSGGQADSRDFGNTPLSQVSVDFQSLAALPGGGDATHATSISCVDSNGASVGSVTDSNTLTSDTVRTNQSSLVCTITFTDP
jgi:SdrD B-like domain